MVKLLSIGTALPAGLLPQQEAFEQARSYNCTNEREERVLQKLYQKTLIETRSTIFSANADSARGTAASSPRNGPNSNSTNGQTATRNLSLNSFYPRPGTTGDSTANCPCCEDMLSSDSQPSTAVRMVRYKEEVIPLAAAAARQALAKIDLPASHIGNLITVSCTGFFAPGLDTEIIQALALPRSVSRTHVGFMGCHGAMNGLRVGAALAKESQSVSLVVAAEICSLHFQYGRKSDDLLANALFADGAAAALLSDGWPNKKSGVSAGADGQSMLPGYSLISSASYLLPDSREAMTWQIGDHGFFMTLGPEVPSLISEHLAPWLRKWLSRFNLDVESVGSWAIHPGGPRVLDAVEQALALDPQALAPSRDIFTRLGNMSSPTILFIIEHLAASAAATPIVALAFGPGLTIEAALFN